MSGNGFQYQGKTKIETLLSGLAMGNSIDEPLGHGGFLHMDRPQPYLCVHRRTPEDDLPGAYRLLAGMGAVFLLSNVSKDADEGSTWIHHIAAMMVDMFGAFLIVEVWPKAVDVAANSTNKRLNFHIHTSENHVQETTLQALEEALIAHDWHGFIPQCNASYEPYPGPEGLTSLMPVINVDNRRRFYLGIEFDTIYREPETQAIRPEVLRSVGTDFSLCLKQAIYAFAQCNSTHKPQHYHQLGSQLVTDMMLKSDTILAEIGQSVDLVFCATPVNTYQARTAFERCKQEKPPEFHYRPLTVSEGALKKHLYDAPVDDIEDPALHFIFAERRKELDRQITMLGDRGKPDFLLGSQQLYERPSPALIQTAKTLIGSVQPLSGDASNSNADSSENREPQEFLTAEQFAIHARAMLRTLTSHQKLNARVEIRGDLPGIMVSNGHLLIGQDAMFPVKRVQAILNHEIGTHIVTHHNGSLQPFSQLQVGLAGYQALQEGIAVIAEYLSGGLTFARIQQIASRVIAVDSVIRGAEFIDTFRLLRRECHVEAKTAFMTTMRAHRSGGFTKDAVYLQGIIEVLDLLGKGHKLENLLIGKFAASHVPIVEELRWRKIIKPPQLLPLYLSDRSVSLKLKVLAKKRTILDLVGDL